MEFRLKENPDETEINEIRHPLQDHNEPHWEVDDRSKFEMTLRNSSSLRGGMVFTIFGEWLEIDFFWVDPKERSKGYGRQILHRVEDYARSRGCKMSFLNTFSFQAKPFYEKNGYKVVYTQQNYPVTNCRYFMEKSL